MIDGGRASKVHHGGRPRGGDDWRFVKDFRVAPCGRAQVQRSVPDGAEKLTSEGVKKVGCDLSSIPRMCETVDEGHRVWMRTGTPSAKPSSKASKERSGKGCISSMSKDIRRSTFPPSTSRKAKSLWETRDAKANGEACYDQGGRQIESRVAVRQALWRAHAQSLVSALEEAREEQRRQKEPVLRKRKRHVNVFLDWEGERISRFFGSVRKTSGSSLRLNTQVCMFSHFLELCCVWCSVYRLECWTSGQVFFLPMVHEILGGTATRADAISAAAGKMENQDAATVRKELMARWRRRPLAPRQERCKHVKCGNASLASRIYGPRRSAKC